MQNQIQVQVQVQVGEQLFNKTTITLLQIYEFNDTARDENDRYYEDIGVSNLS